MWYIKIETIDSLKVCLLYACDAKNVAWPLHFFEKLRKGVYIFTKNVES